VAYYSGLKTLRVIAAGSDRPLEQGSRGITIVRSRYQERSTEDTADGKRTYAGVICKVWKLAIVLYLFVVTTCKYSINPIIQNPAEIHSLTWQYYKLMIQFWWNSQYEILYKIKMGDFNFPLYWCIVKSILHNLTQWLFSLYHKSLLNFFYLTVMNPSLKLVIMIIFILIDILQSLF
jgi:hypothetical protein